MHIKNKPISEIALEPFIPSELFSADQMERHAITLALSHELTKQSAPDMLRGRLSLCEATLIKSCDILTKESHSKDSFSPAREWLLDNFYLIQQQINTINRYLPKGYGRALPKLANRMLGYPRIYDVALEIIKHGDGRWDLESLNRFLNAYQSVTPLTLGELWALPITLGVALIENLSRSSQRIVADRNDFNLANVWADRMIEAAVVAPKKLIIVIADMVRSEPKMSTAFITELARRLQGAALALPLSWIEQYLMDEGLSIEQLVHEENKHQAANQVTISNSITGLKHLSDVNWRDFVEKLSVVEKILQKDPIEIYDKMDFDTRDRYRHVVERLSRRCLHTEAEVAESAIQLAKTSQTNPDNTRHAHVGFYLIGKGRSQLEKALGVRRTFWKIVCQLSYKGALPIYLGSFILITGGLTYALIFKASQSGTSPTWLWILGIVIAVCSSQLGLSLINLAATLLVKPEPLPRMDFTKGLPSTYRTLVVVPAMLANSAQIESLVEALEVRFLGNRDPHMHFALLTDFNDAQSEHIPEDEALLNCASALISALNKQYSSEDTDIFFLFHRRRQWNEREHVWMGKERKRGKLTDLNNLLKENIQTNFLLIVGRLHHLTEVKYIITLDSDTQLPRESARQFVGTMAHPLNRPRLDEKKRLVVEGHAILQPRIAEALHTTGLSRYARLCGHEFGIDPYTRVVSDVYQDVFDEGSFIGKGIYDIDVFQEVLGRRFPDNQILSHDLLEGCYLRSGLLSDVPLYEKSPCSYLVDSKRRIRWIRGDWQIAGWLLPRVFNADRNIIANPLSILSKFKLFDNLRRSLIPVALLVLFALNWTILPATCFWLGIILAIVVLPAVLNTFLELVRKPVDRLPSQHIANIIESGHRRAGQFILYLACLPHEAWYSLDAIVRTCWRLIVSKRHLLEWVSSDQVNQHSRDSLYAWIVSMWMGPAAAGVLLMNSRFESLLFASPLLTLWLISPLIARWLSQPIPVVEPKLHPDQTRFLHTMARKTWSFFETFITAENHWLPPDNYQEAPVAALARRTSPTNIGLSLLANLTAYDFGYINMNQLLERTSNALQTIAKLERYRGHLYNWYNIENLEPLLPRYISTVDSGNLAGHLLTLRQGLQALLDAPLLNLHYLNGLEDTFNVLISESNASFDHERDQFKQLLTTARERFGNWAAALNVCNELCIAANEIVELLRKSNATTNQSEWSNKLLLQCQTLQQEIELFGKAPTLSETITLSQIITLTATDESQRAVCDEATRRLALIHTLSSQIFSLSQMDVQFLYNDGSHLMTIGFNVDEQKQDPGHYDLLCSEARLGSFVAIAQGQIQQESWFALGRLLVANKGQPLLISWSGSMFEYLMPLLVMPTYPNTLLDQTYHSAVKQQIAYGKQRGVPWGVSECGFNALDIQFNYLYRGFGVPGLGLKRGLEEDLVIAPYASALALMVAPEEATANLQRLVTEKASGTYGFYEAIDFTAARLPPGHKKVLVRSFMAHHQGMSFLAFSYLLHNQPMQKRFVADPLFQATLLLLHERIPKPTDSYLKIPKSTDGYAGGPKRPEALMRVFYNPNTRTPQVQLLSNGRYHLVVTQAGSGYSRWEDKALIRWREDSTCDNWGLFCYVRDVMTGEFWSTTYQPTLGKAENFKSIFSESHVEFDRCNKLLDMHTDIVVSPEDDIELRRLRIHNRAKYSRTIEFTSFGEIVLAPQAADQSQPAFSNLFIETEQLPQRQAILATRRLEDQTQASAWLCHLLNVYSDQPFTISYETSRAQFIGRCRTLSEPLAMLEKGPLSNTQGAVLDPIVAIRCQLTLKPDGIVTFDLLTGMTDTREHCVALVEKYQAKHLATRIFRLAWTYAQVLLHQLNISEADAQLYGRLASAIIYSSNTRRAEPQIIASNRRGQSGLWGYSISGDFPIVLLYIEEVANIELVRHLIKAQAYWRRKGLVVDLVILNNERTSYRQSLQEQIMSLVTASSTSEHAGSIVVRIADQVPLEDSILLQSVARVILSDKRGTLKEQLSHRRISPRVVPVLPVTKYLPREVSPKLAPLPHDLQFFNGLGGFSAAGDEYIIRLTNGATTPEPWANVLANPMFGTLVSESGQGYTWTENAHEFRLTPWHNDPLQDTAGEAFYLRDDQTGQIWSPTPLPCRGQGDYQTRHGFGYSVFEHVEDGIYSELWMYVPLDAPVKFIVLKLRNDSSRSRTLSAAGYVAWVLGDLRTKNAMYVVTELTDKGALLAQNHYNTEFGERTAFFDATTTHVELNERTMTGDRAEFIGRNGTLNRPDALTRKHLSGRVGAGLDPCGAIQLSFDLAKGKSREIIFTLGAGQNKQEANALLQHYSNIASAQTALTAVQQYWQRTLGQMKVTTPDPAVDLLANGWLVYQVLSSRLWGRTGYYQSSGAFGFRDQLQDVMSLTHIAPELLRAQILLCAAHQFEEGDVQHWWHPPQNRGVRTRCSDDYLWLPFALCHYIETTGDVAVLDETIPFIQGRPLKPNEESYYDLPMIGNDSVNLYQHCVRAINNGLKFGEHGLPLMGSGDWNDGMNMVGKEGRGESVWLGFFLYHVLKRFSTLASQYGDAAFSERCITESKKLQQQIEEHGWDGQWYRRAYFDDGSPLGSASNSECKIDSIAQSWSVLSGVADPTRANQAMDSLYHHLVSTEDNLIKLLTPPFDKSIPNPGYIEGYLPGIRENGGQYTHAAVWAAMAFAQLGKTPVAWQLFNIINPINHSRNPEETERYKLEPYVTAGDVYSVAPHIGRGGWSWYTGSAGWSYRLITETLLGIRLEKGNTLYLTPLLPDDWDSFNVEYTYKSTMYKIAITRTVGKHGIIVDGAELIGKGISLTDDGHVHQIDLSVP